MNLLMFYLIPNDEHSGNRHSPVFGEKSFSHRSWPDLYSPQVQQGSGAMQIEIRKGLALYPGTFNAVIAPENEIIAAINSNTDLQRFLFLYISGNYSRILSGINRQSKNFDIRRGFTAHQTPYYTPGSRSYRSFRRARPFAF